MDSRTEGKRQVKLTNKASEGLLHQLQKDRQANVNKLKAAIHSTKDLMVKDGNYSIVRSQLEKITLLFEDATLQQTAVIPLLPEEEKEKRR